jgi:hypothetical protein
VKNLNWKVFVDAIGAVAIVAGLVFVGLQLQQDQAISTAELQQEMIAARISLSELEASQSDLLAKANAGDELSDSEQIALESLIMSHWGRAFFGQRRWAAIDHPAVNFPVVGFAIFLNDNPGAMRAWKLRQRKMDDSRSRLDVGLGIQETFDAQLDDYLSALADDH